MAKKKHVPTAAEVYKLFSQLPYDGQFEFYDLLMADKPKPCGNESSSTGRKPI